MPPVQKAKSQADTYQCDGCGTEIILSYNELVKLGWRRHHGGRGAKAWQLLLCPICEPKPVVVK